MLFADYNTIELKAAKTLFSVLRRRFFLPLNRSKQSYQKTANISFEKVTVQVLAFEKGNNR